MTTYTEEEREAIRKTIGLWSWMNENPIDTCNCKSGDEHKDEADMGAEYEVCHCFLCTRWRRIGDESVYCLHKCPLVEDGDECFEESPQRSITYMQWEGNRYDFVTPKARRAFEEWVIERCEEALGTEVDE